MSLEKKASEEFWEALIHSGSNVINCEGCDRTHFVDNPGYDYEEGELKKLYADSKKNPDKVVFHGDSDSVSWGVIDGKQLVYGCPCDTALKYESLIWENRHLIANYIIARAKKIEEHSAETSGLAGKISRAVKE